MLLIISKKPHSRKPLKKQPTDKQTDSQLQERLQADLHTYFTVTSPTGLFRNKKKQ